jgi:hypothetical protein
MTVSRQLLAKISERAAALLSRMDCFQITTGSSDDIGALPADSVCHRSTANDNPSSTPATPTPGNPRVKTSAPQTPPPRAPGEPQPTPPPSSVGPQVPLIPAPPPVVPTKPVDPTIPQLPIPILTVPPLLPGLPAIHIG